MTTYDPLPEHEAAMPEQPSSEAASPGTMYVSASQSSSEAGTKDLRQLHIGFIPDGARRWAAENNVALTEAYDVTFGKLATTVEALVARDVPAVSLYLLSRANLQRTPHELNSFYEALERFLYKYLLEATTARPCHIKAVGSLKLLPASYRNAVQFAVEQRQHSGTRIYLCIAYSPEDELNSALQHPVPGDACQLLSRLWVPEPLDVVIRTSGIPLLSNFLPLQAGYARLYFLPELFNNLDLSDILHVLEEDAARTRKYGT